MFPGDNRMPRATTLRCVELHCILSKAAAAIAPAPSNAVLAMSSAGGGSGSSVRVDNFKILGFPYHKRHHPPRRLACLLEPEGGKVSTSARKCAGNFQNVHGMR